MHNNTSLTAYEEMPENVQDTSVAPKKKNVAYRVFAALVVALAIGVLFIPYAHFFADDKFLFQPFKSSFFKAVLALIKEPFYTMFGFLPTLTDPSMFSGLMMTIALYIVLLCTVIAVILGIITIFCSKKAPAMLRVTVFFLAVGYAIYTISFISLYYLYYRVITLKCVDLVSTGMTVAMSVLFFVLACIKLKKTAIVNVLYWVLSALVTVAMLIMLIFDPLSLANGLVIFGMLELYDIVFYALVGVAVLNLFIASIRLGTKKGLIPDLIRYCLLLLVTGVMLFFQIKLSEDTLAFICSIVAVSVSVVQIVVCSIHIAFAKKAKKQATAAPIEDTVDDVVETPVKAPVAPVAPQEEVEEAYVVEQYAEAIPYEGGPVEGVETAEAVVENAQEPTPPAPTPTVETADYDYYNSKSFDPFIATLSSEERNQFTELFILRYKGTMPEIPDYNVGGNNKTFFRKIFIYLGQYRDRIPEGLLSKMYEFSLKI